MLPLFPLGTVLFPGAVLPLRVFEPRYRQLVHDLLDSAAEQPRDVADGPREFGVVTIRQGWEVGNDAVGALYDVGCTAEIRQVDAGSDGTMGLVTVGRTRFRVGVLDDTRDYLRASVTRLPEQLGDAHAATVLAHSVARVYAAYLVALAEHGQIEGGTPELPTDPLVLSHLIGATAPLDLDDRQQLLAATDAEQRLRLGLSVLTRETTMLARVRAVPVGLAALRADQSAN